MVCLSFVFFSVTSLKCWSMMPWQQYWLYVSLGVTIYKNISVWSASLFNYVAKWFLSVCYLCGILWFLHWLTTEFTDRPLTMPWNTEVFVMLQWSGRILSMSWLSPTTGSMPSRNVTCQLKRSPKMVTIETVRSLAWYTEPVVLIVIESNIICIAFVQVMSVPCYYIMQFGQKTCFLAVLFAFFLRHLQL